MSSYRCNRNAYENLEKRIFDGVGAFGIPELRPVRSIGARSFIGFNYAKSCKDPDGKGIHFFIDDYQFMRLWQRPDNYLDLLSRFACVCTPEIDVSTAQRRIREISGQ